MGNAAFHLVQDASHSLFHELCRLYLSLPPTFPLISHLCLPQAPLSIDEDDNGLPDDAILEPNSSSTTLFCPGMRSTSTPATCQPPHFLGTANFPGKMSCSKF